MYLRVEKTKKTTEKPQKADSVQKCPLETHGHKKR